METVKPNFDPDKPQDVLMYLCLLEDLFSQGRSGVDRAAASCRQMASSDAGRKLLLNCRNLLSEKIEMHLEKSVFRAQQSMLNLVHQFVSYPPRRSERPYVVHGPGSGDRR